MNFIAPLAITTLLLGACATTGRAPEQTDPLASTTILTAEEINRMPADPKFAARMAQYEKLSAQPTPASWGANSNWVFDLYDAKGRPDGSISFRVTDETADTCLGGDWKRLVVLQESNSSTRNPAYSIQGRNLQILLSTELCDAYDQLLGVLDERGFVGKHEFSHLLGGEEFGRVVGRPLLDPDK